MILSGCRDHLGRLFLGRATLAAALLLGGCATIGGGTIAATPDQPETGQQGETLANEAGAILPVPYSKGVNLVGHDPVGGRDSNLTMAWSRSCAYIASGLTIAPDGNLKVAPPSDVEGVAVVDVADPAHPRTVRFLQDKGAIAAAETLSSVTISGRAVLAASTYGGVSGMTAPAEGWLSLYDVSSCAAPKLKATVKWPEPVHTITVSPDGSYVYGTVLNPFTGDGGIEVMDISSLENPRFVGKFRATRADGSQFPFAPHELVFSPDSKRLFVGVVSSQGKDAEHEFKNLTPGVPSPASVGEDAGGLFIFDNSDFAVRKADPRLRLVGSVPHAGWHSPARARINGVPYIVNAGELGACPGAWPKITNVADERNPAIVGEFRLAMNRPENCPPRTQMENATGGMIGRAGIAATHFQDVDNAEDTRLGLFPFMYAGLRIVDLRDPTAPVEVAYFKPGDPCVSHVHYDSKTHNIWFACNRSGFWVVQVKPEVRTAVGFK